MNKKSSTDSTRKKRSARARALQPKDVRGTQLDAAGQELFHWCGDHFNIEKVLPVVLELCRLADRLAQVRNELAKGGVDSRLINSEVKLSASYARAWKMAGFGDPEVKGRVGRPAGVPIQPRVKTGGFGVVS